MPNPIVHVEFTVRDDKKAVEFYGSLFGWEMKYYEGHGWGIGKQDDIGGDIQKNESTFPPHTAIYVEVDDIPAYLEKAKSLGAEPIFGPMDLGSGYGSIGMFKDPDGILVGLYQKPTA
jgi:predicted enzyme related to lactoylglutathione lyase